MSGSRIGRGSRKMRNSRSAPRSPRTYAVSPRESSTRPSCVATIRGAAASSLVSKITASFRNGSIRLNGIDAIPSIASSVERTRGDRLASPLPPTGMPHPQPGAAVRLVEEEHLAGEDEVRISHLLEVHAPELGPAPGALQVQTRDAPQRVVVLDGVDVGRRRQDLGQRNARRGSLLRRRALLRSDREVGLGGERSDGENRDETEDGELPKRGRGRENSSAHQEVSWSEPRARGRKVFRVALEALSRFGENLT